MLYLIYGEDTFRAKRHIDNIVSEERVQIDDPAEVDDAIYNLRQTSLFTTCSLLIFRNLLQSISERQLEKIDTKSHEVVFWEAMEKLDRRKKVVRKVLEEAEIL